LPILLQAAFLFYHHHHHTTIIIITTTIIIIIIIIIKIADNITAIPLLEVCSTECSEITIKGLNHQWASYLLENLLLMDVTFLRVRKFYVLFPQNVTQ
jgi:hypothetical protein